MLFETYLETEKSCLTDVFARYEQSRDDVWVCLNPSVAKALCEENLPQIEDRELKSDLPCERAMAAQVLWLGKKGKNLDMCKAFVLAMYDYFESDSWYDDEPLVLHYVLKTFSYYFPIRSLPHCSVEEMKEVENLVQSISSHVQTQLCEYSMQLPRCEYWVIKALYPLYDTKKGPVPGLDSFCEAVRALYEHFIQREDVFHAGWIVSDMQDCTFLDWSDLNPKIEQLASCLLKKAMNDNSLRGLNMARQAAGMFQKIDNRPEYDRAMCVIRDSVDNMELVERVDQIPDELLKMLDERREQTIRFLEKEKANATCFDCLELLFETVRFPSKKGIQESTAKGIPLSYHIAQIQSLTEGRFGLVGCCENEAENQEELEAHWACQLYLAQLPVVTLLDVEELWSWLSANYPPEELQESFVMKYRASLFYETERAELVAYLGKKVCEKDWTGFLYPGVLQIEHFLRLFLHKTGHNVSAGNLKKIENLTMGSLLKKFEKPLSAQFGSDFWYFLWIMLGYAHGPNLRNALAHGLGISYLNSFYGMLFMYALGYLWHNAPVVVGVRKKGDKDMEAGEGKGKR
ncbi:MAG: DUF4209 domain-containing protein [Desulfoplanes sp.]